jgi:hypothetical protein
MHKSSEVIWNSAAMGKVGGLPADGAAPGVIVEVANSGACRISGSSALVSMMKPTYLGKRYDLSHLRRRYGPAIRRILPERKVASRTMVIIKIRNQMVPERNLIQDDDMVEAFSADRADPPFDVRALPGRSESGENLIFSC